MKLKFKTQTFQTDAVNAVADLFAGQNKQTTTFSIVEDNHGAYTRLDENKFGIGNALTIRESDLLINMNRVQKRNNLPSTKDLYPFAHFHEGDRRFCIEMETGTGKTYVYTKTIFELHKRYGFTKFIVVVPSVAIREGVYKSLQITADHFGAHYDNVPCRYFIYNSAKLSDVRQFATSNNIEIMIINIDAFKKAENIINQAQDKLNGETAMRYIQDTNPVVIIDEPQSVDNTPKAREAIQSLNPFVVLRYSATHKEKVNLLYRLTPVDAYQKGLVKQIVVSSNAVDNAHNKPYIALKSVSRDGGFKAKIEIDVLGKGGAVTRKTITAKHGDDLFTLSGNRDLYEGYQLTGIDIATGREFIEFSNTETLELGKTIGGVNEDVLKRAQIFRTIEAHLDKELRYMEQGIKVLSLFFIDEVAKYRTAEGEKGLYAQLFESCYEELINRPKYATIRSKFTSTVASVHNGYFSQDKKGVYKNTKGDTLADDDTYNTIMRDKEWLLSFDCPLRFIFSHSTLKEGWDNPNVFQVCTLIEHKSTFTQRQKIGRGLRLCVNQDGNRIEDREINTLHVMANESFAEFADSLQKEIEAETGITFGMFQIDLLVGQSYEEEVIVEKTVTVEQATEVVEILKNNGEVDSTKGYVASIIDKVSKKAEERGCENTEIAVEAIIGTTYTEQIIEEKIISYDEAEEIMADMEKSKLIIKDKKSGNYKMTDTMKKQLETGTLDLNERHSQAKQRAIIEIAQRANAKVIIRDDSKKVRVKLKKQVYESPLFKDIWDKIKQKTTYRVKINFEQLLQKCINDFANMPAIPKARIVTQSAELNIENAGVTHTERGLRTLELQDDYTVLPDILHVIATEAKLKRSDVGQILRKSNRGADFLNNPQAFTEKAMEIITRNRHALAVDGISYIKLAGEEYYAQQIFTDEELQAYLDHDALAVNHSLYDHMVYDSGVESRFAQSLDNDPDVKLFFKIPSRFTIDTPIGTYNPDWAVYLEHNGDKKLYFIIETKGTTTPSLLRTPEQQKLKCGIAHFTALENDIIFPAIPVRDWYEFKRSI
ncbi:MAG: DEAD/DEAH box helicase family protein [Defluviitaleaceae bacterium]|nr:DEAD/DEAH box helicase family protein [Defluviitaleaceae bacterium]MCL2263938.1 DEAD/DEAH box helicase family protein [Defluviitaleaceae bacterium]